MLETTTAMSRRDIANEAVREVIKEFGQAEMREEFKRVDRKTLLNMPDSELALWQSEYSPEAPHYILAEFEWQRRLNHEQIKVTKFSAWLGLIGALAGVILGFTLSQIETNYAKTVTQNNPGNKANQDKTQPPTFPAPSGNINNGSK